jgi:hypothetical protein
MLFFTHLLILNSDFLELKYLIFVFPQSLSHEASDLGRTIGFIGYSFLFTGAPSKPMKKPHTPESFSLYRVFFSFYFHFPFPIPHLDTSCSSHLGWCEGDSATEATTAEEGSCSMYLVMATAVTYRVGGARMRFGKQSRSGGASG